jgi:predicted N-formylglutamate amidohydrolase
MPQICPETDWPSPVEILNEHGRSKVVLICEHASNHIPTQYHGLGLSDEDLARHIAWDVGAGALTRQLSESLDAPAFIAGYSRLLIDLNRPRGAPDSIIICSEATDVPGNAAVPQAERDLRYERIFQPFHEAITCFLDERVSKAAPTCIISIHSFTPSFLGRSRPWHAGVLFGAAKGLADDVIGALRESGALHVGANVPYTTSPDDDYALFVHGDQRGLPALLLEIRSDGVADQQGVDRWAAILARVIGATAAL